MKRKKLSNFGEVLFMDTVYRPAAGSFGKPRSDNGDRYVVCTWHSCRDIWHNQMYNAKIFFYAHEACKNKSIAAFFERVEDMLKLESPSQFGPTQKKSIMYIKPSRWWLKYAMRRSLFTILLRSSTGYDISSENFEEALRSDVYASRTSIAINHFLSGNTVYKGRKRGWYKQFCEPFADDGFLGRTLMPE